MSRKILIKESELVKLIETAMDLDIYIQTPNVASGSRNKDSEDATEDVIEKLKELLNMFQSGKKVSTGLKSELYKNIDSFNKTYERIKYNP
jgi:TATA-box binding protein (TBP) (component of TFIID and TFIIIB)